MEQAVLDNIIKRLLEVRGKPGKQVQLSESEIRQLCVVSREIFMQQPNLLELEASIKICGIFLSLNLLSFCVFEYIKKVPCFYFGIPSEFLSFLYSLYLVYLFIF